jgi:hypothetical protein
MLCRMEAVRLQCQLDRGRRFFIPPHDAPWAEPRKLPRPRSPAADWSRRSYSTVRHITGGKVDPGVRGLA